MHLELRAWKAPRSVLSRGIPAEGPGGSRRRCIGNPNAREVVRRCSIRTVRDERGGSSADKVNGGEETEGRRRRWIPHVRPIDSGRMHSDGSRDKEQDQCVTLSSPQGLWLAQAFACSSDGSLMWLSPMPP